MKTVPMWKVTPCGAGSKIDENFVAVYTDQPIPAELAQTPMHLLFDFEKGSDIDRAYVAVRKADIAALDVKVVTIEDVADR